MNFVKKHLKLLILILVVLIIAGVAVFVILKNRNKGEEMDTSSITTETIERQDISNYVSLTGTIEANDSQTVYSTINGVEVLDVRVEVGDTVKAGDVIAVLDSSDYEDKLATAQKNLQVTNAKTALNLKQAQDKVAQANEDALDAVKEAQTSLDRAGTDYGYSSTDISEAYNDYQDALENYEDAKEEYNKAKKKYRQLTNGTSIEYKKKEYDATNDDDVASFLNIKESLKDAMESAEDKVTSAQRQYNSMNESAEKTYRNYDDALEKQQDTVTEQSRKIQEAEENLQSAQLDAQVSSSQTEDQIKEYQKQIDKCTITAPIDGVITSVDMEVGDETDSDNNEICVIQDTSGYKVEGTVDEYGIAQVSVGMKAVIRTEATEDLEMTGVVSFVSPTPKSSSSASNASTSSSSSSVEYPIKITIDELDSNVRIGMTAETNILIESAEDVLTLPYDCVVQNAAGDYVIYAADGPAMDANVTSPGGKVTVADEDMDKLSASENSAPEGMEGGMKPEGGHGSGKGHGSRNGSNSGSSDEVTAETAGREIVVTKGLETDYYTEISSDEIYEGMRVYVPSNTGDSDSDSDEGFSDFGGGHDGGGPGGGGPGGGGPGGF